MNFLRCYIVNYGCLHDRSFDFHEGINTFSLPNGWGKTTLCSFLCAMLYGLDGTSRRSLQANERKHYTPWQGGRFGGFLEFETGSRTYRVERFFGHREKEDHFVLYNLQTMQPSRDFSKDLGTELFGIDRAGYLRSTCILQGLFHSPASSSLSARLSSLNCSADDMKQYETAQSALDAALHFYVKTGKRGQIAQLEQQKDSLQQSLHETRQKISQLQELSLSLEQTQKEKEDRQRRLHQIREQIARYTLLEVRQHYQILLNQQQKYETALEELEDFFQDQLPEESELDSYLSACSRLADTEQAFRQQTFTDSQNQEFDFLKDFFLSADDSHMGQHGSALSDDSSSSVTAGEHLLNDFQRTLLFRESSPYRAQARLLFSDTPETEDPSFPVDLPEELPDLEWIDQMAKTCKIYRDTQIRSIDCLQSLNRLEETISTTQNQIVQEQQALEDCSRKQENLSVNSPLVSSKNPSGSAASFFKTFEFRIGILITGLCSLILGVFFSPVAGLAVLLSGGILTCLLVKKRIHSAKESSPGTDSDFIRLEGEIQARNDTLSRQEDQLRQLQQEQLRISHQYEAFNDHLKELQETLKQQVGKLPVSSKDLFLDSSQNPLQISEDYLIELSDLRTRIQLQQQRQEQQYALYKKQLGFYKELQQRYSFYEIQNRKQQRTRQNILDLKEDLVQYLHAYFPDKALEHPQDMNQAFIQLKERLTSYKNLLLDLKQVSLQIKSFLREHPDFTPDRDFIQEDTAFEDRSFNKTFKRPLSELHQEESLLQKQYADCTRQEGILLSQTKQLMEDTRQASALEDELSAIKVQIDTCSDHHRILTLTSQYLEQAKQNLSESYLRSIERNFQSYAAFFDKKFLNQARLDSDFHIRLSDKGVFCEAEWYSQGTQDLIHLCIRLSIIKDLFPEESPVLIFDDPFVNLDSSVFSQIAKILHSLSRQWQILYFTCHPSRELPD